MASMPVPGAVTPQAGGVVSRNLAPGVERHTTRENISMFFDPGTYRAQKRVADAAPTPPTAKARLTKDALLERFKLAASLHGYELRDLFAAGL